MLFYLIDVPELAKYGCTVKVHVREDESHELDFLEVVDKGEGCEACENVDTVDWNSEALEELERGVRRGVARALAKDVKDITLLEPLSRVKEIWCEARGGRGSLMGG